MTLGTLEKVVLLYVLEILVSINLELTTSSIVSNDDSMGVQLKAADGPHMVDTFLNTVLQGTGLVVAIHHDHHLLGIHDGSYTNGQSGLGDFVDVVVKKTTVGDDGIGGEGLLTGAARQTGAGLIEGDMSVGAYATHEEVDASCCLNGFLVVLALCLQVLGIAIEDMDVLFLNVDVVEEVVPHEAMIAFGVLFGEVHVLVHVERDHVLERYLAGLVHGNQFSVHSQRGTAGWATEFKGLVCRWLGIVDTLGYVVGSPL